MPVFSRVASKPCSKCMEGDFGAAVRPWSDWFAALAVPGRWEALGKFYADTCIGLLGRPRRAYPW